MQSRLTDYIRRPDTMGAEESAELGAMTKEFPYFHCARILYLQSLYKQHSPNFDEELRRSAVLIPDRSALFRLIEEKNYSKSMERRKYAGTGRYEDKSDLTNTLINDFLDRQPQQNTPARHRIDATQDYIGYMLQNEAEGASAPDIPMNGGGVVEMFLNQEPQRIVLKDTDEKPSTPPEDAKNDDGGEILTEVMAGIYIKQGKFENAIKIIRQLSLKYPKKNRYFADQIRFLEKLIINNKNQ